MAPAAPGLSARVLDGDGNAIARLLTRVENDDDVGRAGLEKLLPHAGKAHLVGITGPPGGGKSSLANELIRAYRRRGKRVAVLAIDPSSPLTGGATLGDRIRMLEWHDDPGVFIRSMASRRFGGGLAQNTLAAATVFDAAGYDPIFIETVGTGQDEVAIAQLAHTTVLVQVPGLGDGVQALKAGSLEVGDLIVVTKADRPEANELARDLRRLRTLTYEPDTRESDWEPPVIKTSALTGEGIADLVEAIDRHRIWLRETGELAARLRAIAATQLADRVRADLMEQIAVATHDERFGSLVDAIARRRLTPQQASKTLLDALDPNHAGSSTTE
ncbi:MAG TPA: methylmalonyl Co-A mutase-associated GTPase MeaB [Thermomicrobiales bacterium]|nr:methylmalonyl Co-A mutase-associated GTPase MeaB [Thermomicrobiales bacterium]